jgi:hypothetical protein
VFQPSSSLEEYPKDYVYGASGHPLTKNNSLICGGFNDYVIFDDCYSINENGIEATAKILNARYLSASVVLNSKTLWLTALRQGYIVRFGQCSVFLIPINKRQPLEISVVLSRWGRCTVVNSAPIVKRSWNQEKYTLPWPCMEDTLIR